MSETRIVNRFPITAGLDRDLQEIAQAQTEAEEIVTQAEKIVNPAVDSISTGTAAVDPKDVPPTAGTPAQSATYITDQFPYDQSPIGRDETLANEIASLRASTIRALKHLGVDTRKFFS